MIGKSTGDPKEGISLDSTCTDLVNSTYDERALMISTISGLHDRKRIFQSFIILPLVTRGRWPGEQEKAAAAHPTNCQG